jgi:hypothetical protein
LLYQLSDQGSRNSGQAATIVLDNGPVHQSQVHPRRAGRARALAHPRMTAKIWARTQRHRARLENSQNPSSRRDALNAEIEAGIQDMNSKRKTQAFVKLRISA